MLLHLCANEEVDYFKDFSIFEEGIRRTWRRYFCKTCFCRERNIAQNEILGC